MAELTLYPLMQAEVATDSGDHTTYNLIGYELQASPVPKVWVNGSIKIVATDYTIDPGSATVHASITFNVANAAADVVTCTYQWKHECSSDEDVNVYTFTKDSNVVVQKDVNGNNMVTLPINKFTAFAATLTWPYPSYDWYDQLKAIVELPGSTIDFERTSLSSTSMDRVNNLYPNMFPTWQEEPGVVGFLQEMTLTLVQIG